MSYIDTQGMSLASNDTVTSSNIQHSPIPVKKMNVFTDLDRKELKEIINEVLDEREQRYYKNNDDSWLYRGTY